MMSCSPESPFEGSIVRAARENSEVRSQA
jgi:hypothetical protein